MGVSGLSPRTDSSSASRQFFELLRDLAEDAMRPDANKLGKVSEIKGWRQDSQSAAL